MNNIETEEITNACSRTLSTIHNIYLHDVVTVIIHQELHKRGLKECPYCNMRLSN